MEIPEGKADGTAAGDGTPPERDQGLTARFKRLPPAVPITTAVATVGTVPTIPLGPEGAAGGDGD